MAVLRSDFMIDIPSDTPKLVEYNTIACSFGILSQKVAEMQKYIRDKYQIPLNYARLPDDDLVRFAHDKMLQFSDNMVNYFKEAIDRYSKS